MRLHPNEKRFELVLKCMILNYIDLPVNNEKLKMDVYTWINKIKFRVFILMQ